MHANSLPARTKPSWPFRTASAAVAIVLLAACAGYIGGLGGIDGDGVRPTASPAIELPFIASTQDEHPEWVVPFALSVGDFTAPAPEVPRSEVAAAPARPRPDVPTWLAGQADASPHAIVRTWEAYARTQGPSLDAARELVAYARLHPSRTVDANGATVDAWLQAAAAAPTPVLPQMVAAGYLDDSIARLFETSDATRIADVVRDMDLASRCTGTSCASWRARYAMAYLEERSERQNPTLRCSTVAAAPTSAGARWLVDEDDPAAHDVARAMDAYLARQRSVSCGTVSG